MRLPFRCSTDLIKTDARLQPAKKILDCKGSESDRTCSIEKLRRERFSAFNTRENRLFVRRACAEGTEHEVCLTVAARAYSCRRVSVLAECKIHCAHARAHTPAEGHAHRRRGAPTLRRAENGQKWFEREPSEHTTGEIVSRCSSRHTLRISAVDKLLHLYVFLVFFYSIISPWE